MGAVVGPSKSHSSYINWPDTALGATVCGGRLFCKSLGIAWIVAPAATQVGRSWSSTNALVGNKPCVSDWGSLSTALTNEGLTPSQWLVPSNTQLLSGYACRTYWDSFSSARYWSSTERNSTAACYVQFATGGAFYSYKANSFCVRAFRCVTY